MTAAVLIVLSAIFVPLILFWGVWLALALAAVRRRPENQCPEGPLPRVDVLVPAHDEEALLPGLLGALPAAEPGLGRVMVVADHCIDATAAVAAAAGALVLVRQTGPRGKPAALRAGLAALAALPDRGAGVLILDADCLPNEGYVARMAACLAAGDAVAQSAYLMERPPTDDAGSGVHFGVLLKNVVRPTGEARLGLPCQLLGTGMLFREDVLTRVCFRDDLVEDVRMSHDLIRAGVRPRFVPEAEVISCLPPDRAGLTQQRLRWEGGQLSAMRTGLALAVSRLVRRDLCSAAALVGWSAPPLALAVGAWAVGTCLDVAMAGAGAIPLWALALPAVSAAVLAAYLAVGVGVAGGPGAVLQLIRTAPRFLAWKAGIYLRLASGQGPRGWARTPRAAANARREVSGS